MDYKLIFRCPLYLLLALVGTALFTWAVIERHEGGMAVGAGILVGSFALYVRMLKRQHEGLALILEAIHNGDYSFRLPTNGYRNASLQMFNTTANGIGTILAREKQAMLIREKYYEVILQHVATGVVVISGGHDIVLNNEAALRLLNVPRLDKLEQLPEDKREAKECFLTLQPGDNGNLIIHTRQGARQLLVRVVSLVQNETPLRIFTLNDVRNVLDEREMDAWVKLTRVLVHEIANGMTPVCSLSSSMLNKPSLTSEQLHDGLAAIHATSQGLLHFVENYRKFTSLPKPRPDILVVRELLAEVVSLQMLPSEIHLTVQVHPDDLMVYADRHLIRQVFINLLRNAAQAIGEKEGHIDITAALTENEHVLIYVSNDGPAVKAEDAEQLFVPFYTTKRNGSGIGLSVSRQILVQSNGNITLLPPGTRGWNTTFLVEFY